MAIHDYPYCPRSHPPWPLAWTTIIASKLVSLPVIHSAHSRQRGLQRRAGGEGVQEGNLIMPFTSLCLWRTKSLIWPKRTCTVWSLPTSAAPSSSIWFPALSALSTLAIIHCYKTYHALTAWERLTTKSPSLHPPTLCILAWAAPLQKTLPTILQTQWVGWPPR